MFEQIKTALRPLYRPMKEFVRRVVHGPTRYGYLFSYIQQCHPTRILEIGTWNGNRAIQMIKTAQKISSEPIEYYGFDLFDEMNDGTFVHEISKRPPTKAEVETRVRETGAAVTLIQGNTMTLPNSVWEALPKMDFVFIDGGHSLETIQNDWEHVQPLMHARTVVIFDDYWNRVDSGARPVVDAISREEYQVKILPITDEFEKEWGTLKIQFALVQKRPQ